MEGTATSRSCGGPGRGSGRTSRSTWTRSSSGTWRRRCGSPTRSSRPGSGGSRSRCRPTISTGTGPCAGAPPSRSPGASNECGRQGFEEIAAQGGPPRPPARRVVVRRAHRAPRDLPHRGRRRPLGRAAPPSPGVGPPRDRRAQPRAPGGERPPVGDLAPRRAADRAGRDPAHGRPVLRRRAGPRGPPLTARGPNGGGRRRVPGRAAPTAAPAEPGSWARHRRTSRRSVSP
jgi:hypothetical protein